MHYGPRVIARGDFERSSEVNKPLQSYPKLDLGSITSHPGFNSGPITCSCGPQIKVEVTLEELG